MNRECEQKERNQQWCVQQDPLPEGELYDFEKITPPMMTERMLQRKLDEEQARKQALLVTIAGILTQLLLLVSMVLLHEYMPGVALVGIGYVAISLAAGLIAVAVYVERRTTG